MGDDISLTGNLFGRLERELGLPTNWLFTLAMAARGASRLRLPRLRSTLPS